MDGRFTLIKNYEWTEFKWPEKGNCRSSRMFLYSQRFLVYPAIWSFQLCSLPPNKGSPLSKVPWIHSLSNYSSVQFAHVQHIFLPGLRFTGLESVKIHALAVVSGDLWSAKHQIITVAPNAVTIFVKYELSRKEDYISFSIENTGKERSSHSLYGQIYRSDIFNYYHLPLPGSTL